MSSKEDGLFFIAGPLAVVPAHGLVRLLELQEGSVSIFLALAFVYVIVLALVFWAEPRVCRP